MPTYQERIYRQQMKADDLYYFQIKEDQTDLYIGVDEKALDLKKIVLAEVKKQREAIYHYERSHPGFIQALSPLADNPKALPIIKEMLQAGRQTGIGPMGAVAGAMVKQIGQVISPFSDTIIIENGGDLFIRSTKTRRISLYTKNPYFKGLALKIKAMPSLGICTSSGTLGHSLSFGKADSVTVISENPALADAAATALGNRIKGAGDIEEGLAWIKKLWGIKGVLVTIDDKLGAWGDIELC